MVSDNMTKAQRKGRRNENEAKNILGRVWRHVERLDGYANTDPFNIIDVMAMDPNITPGVLLAQVKTNRITKKDKTKIRDRARALIPKTVRIEAWVRIDYQGWEAYKLDWDTGEFVPIIKMDTVDKEDTVEAYRDAVPFYPKERMDHSELKPPRVN